MLSPKIIIPTNIRNKIQFIVDNCSMEVSGLGTVVFDSKENGYRVTGMILLPQEVGAAHTDLDDNAVAQACYEMRDCEGELAFWWHSHVDMGVFWSGTDHNTMELIGKNGLCVAIVFNKKEEMRGAIVMKPAGFPASKIDDVEIEVEHEYDFCPFELLEEIKLKVKPKIYAPISFGTSGHTNSVLGDVDKVSYKSNVTATRAERQLALDQWSKMTAKDRDYYKGFPEYLEEYIWGEDQNIPNYYNSL